VPNVIRPPHPQPSRWVRQGKPNIPSISWKV